MSEEARGGPGHGMYVLRARLAQVTAQRRWAEAARRVEHGSGDADNRRTVMITG